MKNLYRQGDLLITQITKLPENLKAHSLTLVLGESTGHSHRLTKGKAFTDKDGLLYLSLSKNSQIVHEEHNTIDLPAGKYAVIRQREYVSKDMTKIVLD